MLDNILQPTEMFNGLEGFLKPTMLVAPFVHTTLNTPGFESGMPGCQSLSQKPFDYLSTSSVKQNSSISPFIAPYEAPTIPDIEYGLNKWKNDCEIDPSIAEHFNQQQSCLPDWSSGIEYIPALSNSGESLLKQDNPLAQNNSFSGESQIIVGQHYKPIIPDYKSLDLGFDKFEPVKTGYSKFDLSLEKENSYANLCGSFLEPSKPIIPALSLLKKDSFEMLGISEFDYLKIKPDLYIEPYKKGMELDGGIILKSYRNTSILKEPLGEGFFNIYSHHDKGDGRAELNLKSFGRKGIKLFDYPNKKWQV